MEMELEDRARVGGSADCHLWQSYDLPSYLIAPSTQLFHKPTTHLGKAALQSPSPGQATNPGSR